jgi:hypothetical protein
MEPSIKQLLWHKMRGDLAAYVPETASHSLLMCCACGLPAERVLRSRTYYSPAGTEGRSGTRSGRSGHPANTRAGNLLLCRKPLLYRGSKLYDDGCNSWKGRSYDKPITKILTQVAKKWTGVHKND